MIRKLVLLLAMHVGHAVLVEVNFDDSREGSDAPELRSQSINQKNQCTERYIKQFGERGAMSPEIQKPENGGLLGADVLQRAALGEPADLGHDDPAFFLTFAFGPVFDKNNEKNQKAALKSANPVLTFNVPQIWAWKYNAEKDGKIEFYYAKPNKLSRDRTNSIGLAMKAICKTGGAKGCPDLEFANPKAKYVDNSKVPFGPFGDYTLRKPDDKVAKWRLEDAQGCYVTHVYQCSWTAGDAHLGKVCPEQLVGAEQVPAAA